MMSHFSVDWYYEIGKSENPALLFSSSYMIICSLSHVDLSPVPLSMADKWIKIGQEF